MKINSLLTVPLLLPVVLLAQSAAPGSSQSNASPFVTRSVFQESRPATPAAPGQAVSPIAGGGYPGAISSRSSSPASGFYRTYGQAMSRASKKENDLNRQISAATRDLRSGDEDKRLAAAETLQTSLDELFDERTKTREQQISDLENRLKKLRDQLEARKEKKSEIVRLRLRTLVNEANGLSL